MRGRIDRLPDGTDAAGDAGRGFVVHDHDCLDGMAPILSEPRLDEGRIDAMAPVAGDEVDLEAEPLGKLAP